MHLPAPFARAHILRVFLFVVLLLLPQLALATTCGFGSPTSNAQCQGYLTSGTSWTVPSDWNSSNNKIEAIGGGGSGGAGIINGAGNGECGGGGGGGAYAETTDASLTPGATVHYAVGAGGAAISLSSTGASYGNNGSSSWLRIDGGSTAPTTVSQGVLAQYGSGGPASNGGTCNGGSGGTTGSSLGSTLYAGGSGGGGYNAYYIEGAGGAGAAGPNGAGNNGTSCSYNCDGAGGSGDNGYGGAGGSTGGTGGNGTEWSASYGSGGGGSGFATSYTGVAGAGGSYGAGGGGVGAFVSTSVTSGAGTQGLIVITYTSAPPTCSVTFTQNPLPYGSQTTVTWTSSNAIDLYINNVGYVGASGATSVGPLATTDYSCQAGNGTATSTTPASLTVTPPPSPTATIAASSTSIYVGQSTNVLADFAAGSGDTLTASNIDSPVGTGLGANTNPGPKSITFTPASAGSYTLYARATTQYYPSWTTYNSVTVTVTAAPQCSVTLTPSSISGGQSSTLTYSSSNATSFSINNVVGPLTPNTSNSTTVSPSVTTDYTGSATAGGVTNTCPASLTVSCAPAYSCSGQTVQHTDSSCNVSNITTCVSPAYCSAGSAVCLYPQPQYNPSGDYSGHLQINPSVVPEGTPTYLYWNVSYVSSCTLTGTNGDSFSGDSSPGGGQQTAIINSETTYTLQCTGDDGSSLSESKTVNVVPVFEER